MEPWPTGWLPALPTHWQSRPLLQKPRAADATIFRKITVLGGEWRRCTLIISGISNADKQPTKLSICQPLPCILSVLILFLLQMSAEDDMQTKSSACHWSSCSMIWFLPYLMGCILLWASSTNALGYECMLAALLPAIVIVRLAGLETYPDGIQEVGCKLLCNTTIHLPVAWPRISLQCYWPLLVWRQESPAGWILPHFLPSWMESHQPWQLQQYLKG